MKFNFKIFPILLSVFIALALVPANAQSAKKSPPTAQSVKALIAANKNGGSALTQALIAAIKANPALAEVIAASAEGAAPALLASISAALSQAIVEIAQTNPAAAAQIKSAVEAKAPEALKQQIALNLAASTTATATTGSNAGPLGDVGVPLSVTTPSSSRSPT